MSTGNRDTEIMAVALATRAIADARRTSAAVQAIAAGLAELARQPGPAGIDGKDGRPGLDGRDGADGADGKLGPRGPQGEPGPRGERGPMPRHEWQNTHLRFELPEGKWGPFVDLQGPPGRNGLSPVAFVGGDSSDKDAADLPVIAYEAGLTLRVVRADGSEARLAIGLADGRVTVNGVPVVINGGA